MLSVKQVVSRAVILVLILLFAAWMFGCGNQPSNTPLPEDKENLTLPNPATPPELKEDSRCKDVKATIHTVIIRYGMTTDPEKRAKAYDPKELEIKACDKVIWRNEDKNTQGLATAYHNATTDNLMMFNTEPILYGKESKPVQIVDLGEYPYHCHPHPWMKGKIFVRPR